MSYTPEEKSTRFILCTVFRRFDVRFTTPQYYQPAVTAFCQLMGWRGSVIMTGWSANETANEMSDETVRIDQ